MITIGYYTFVRFIQLSIHVISIAATAQINMNVK